MAFEKSNRTEDQLIFVGDNILVYFDKQASLLAATAQAAEVFELKRKVEVADEDIVRINKRFDEAQGMFEKLFTHRK